MHRIFTPLKIIARKFSFSSLLSFSSPRPSTFSLPISIVSSISLPSTLQFSSTEKTLGFNLPNPCCLYYRNISKKLRKSYFIKEKKKKKRNFRCSFESLTSFQNQFLGFHVALISSILLDIILYWICMYIYIYILNQSVESRDALRFSRVAEES